MGNRYESFAQRRTLGQTLREVFSPDYFFPDPITCEQGEEVVSSGDLQHVSLNGKDRLRGQSYVVCRRTCTDETCELAKVRDQLAQYVRHEQERVG